MELFFLRANSFLKEIDLKSLSCFEKDKVFLTEKRQKEFTLGRFLVNFVLKNHYKMDDFEIIVENKKPRLETSEIHFSLSHSNDIVAVVFDYAEVGFDVEFMKERNFEKLFHFYKLNPEKRDKNTFYDFWTKYEAKIKLQSNPVSSFSACFLNDYKLSVCSCLDYDIKNKFNVYEVVCSSESKVECFPCQNILTE